MNVSPPLPSVRRDAARGSGRTDTQQSPGWWRRAACRDRGDAWLAENAPSQKPGELNPTQQTAVSVCVTSCPVIRSCAIESFVPSLREHFNYRDHTYVTETGGIWAGLLPEERHGHTVKDVDWLLAWSRWRSVELGLAPPDIPRGVDAEDPAMAPERAYPTDGGTDRGARPAGSGDGREGSEGGRDRGATRAERGTSSVPDLWRDTLGGLTDG